jgi:hypothetical protein
MRNLIKMIYLRTGIARSVLIALLTTIMLVGGCGFWGGAAVGAAGAGAAYEYSNKEQLEELEEDYEEGNITREEYEARKEEIEEGSIVY